MAAKTNKLKIVEEGGYGLIRVAGKLRPCVYKDMITAMTMLGVNNETTFISMALKSFNHITLKDTGLMSREE